MRVATPAPAGTRFVVTTANVRSRGQVEASEPDQVDELLAPDDYAALIEGDD